MCGLPGLTSHSERKLKNGGTYNHQSRNLPRAKLINYVPHLV